jgi:hypothetical protein
MLSPPLQREERKNHPALPFLLPSQLSVQCQSLMGITSGHPADKGSEGAAEGLPQKAEQGRKKSNHLPG